MTKEESKKKTILFFQIMRKSMFEMLFKKLIHHSHLLHIFWQDIFDFMVDMDPHHGYVPNFDNT